METPSENPVYRLKHLPLTLKVLLVFWPFLGVLPFVAAICMGFVATSRFGIHFSSATRSQIVAIRWLAIKVFALAVAFGFIYLLGGQSKIQDLAQGIQLASGFCLLAVYFYMLYVAFFRIKGLNSE